MGEGEIRDIAGRLHSSAIRLLRTLRREDDGSGLSAPRLSALSVIVFGGPPFDVAVAPLARLQAWEEAHDDRVHVQGGIRLAVRVLPLP